MISGKTVLGLITARGGSKGLKRKNVRMAAGKPLIAWTIESAQKSSLLDRVILSSDDGEIIDVARRFGCESPFVRPAELATDQAESISVACHAMQMLEESYDYLIILQPTSPLRTPEDIDGAIRICVEGEATACVSACELGKSSQWMFHLSESSRMEPLIPRKPAQSRRQDSPPLYVSNGALFMAKSPHLMSGGDFYPPDAVVWVMPKSNSIDIDTEFDLRTFEWLVNASMQEGVFSNNDE